MRAESRGHYQMGCVEPSSNSRSIGAASSKRVTGPTESKVADNEQSAGDYCRENGICLACDNDGFDENGEYCWNCFPEDGKNFR